LYLVITTTPRTPVHEVEATAPEVEQATVQEE
jgi:hypothetical protein